MSDYIYTSDGELYHADELYHYGVPGMKWGRRRAQKYANAARISRAKTKEWEIKKQKALSRGKKRKAAQYEENAKLERSRTAMFDQQSKGLYSKRANKLNKKASIAKESAKEWDELSKIARDKGKLARSEKFAQYAKQDRAKASRYDQKAKSIIPNRLKRREFISDVSRTTMDRGKKAVSRAKAKMTGRKKK